MAVIINLAAGTRDGEGTRKRLQSLFAAHRFEPGVLLARDAAEVARITAEVLANGVGTVVVGGGDGTIGTAASALIGTGRTLGVLPLGTLNHFCKDLGVPLDLNEAVHCIIEHCVAEIDVAEVNGHTFVNNSSLGLYPHMVAQRERYQRRGWGKWVGFFWATLETLRRYPFVRVRLNVDGKELTRKTPFLFVGNNIYTMEGLRLGKRRALNEGQLCLYIAHRTGRLRLLRLSVRALLGRLRESRDFDMFRARDIWVDSKRHRLRVALDGELVVLDPPLHYRIRPKALRVIVPCEKATRG